MSRGYAPNGLSCLRLLGCATALWSLSGPLWAQEARDTPASASAAAEEPRFEIVAFDIEGVTLLDPRIIESAVYEFTGPDRKPSDVDAARASLEKAFQDRGYQSVAVEIPPQTVAEGIVKLKVIEAPVGQVRVTGARYFSPEFLKSQVASLKPGAVPDFGVTQSQLAEANRMGDRQVTPILRPGKVPGTLDVELKVKDHLPFHGSLEATNDHARDTPEWRANATLRYDNLWQLGHSVSLTYLVAPEDKSASEVVSGSYMAPIWGSRWTLLGFGYASNSNVATLGGVNVLGKGYGLGLRGIRQLPALGDTSQTLSIGMDFKRSNQNIRLSGTVQKVSIDYWPITGSWTLQGADERFSSQLTLGFTAGVTGWGDAERAFAESRADARPNFIRANMDLESQVKLGADFSGVIRIRGQVADQPLLSTEQFAAGGNTSVRGYLQSEAVGDIGLSTSLELVTPLVAPSLSPALQDWRFYAYLDGAALRVLEPTADQQSQFSLISFGLGTRFQVYPGVRGDVAFGVPVRNAGGATKAWDANAVVSLRSEF